MTTTCHLTVQQTPPAEIYVERLEIPAGRSRSSGSPGASLPKSLADFGGDQSRQEVSSLATLSARLQPMLIALSDSFSHEYDDTEKACLRHDVLIALIPHRDKHEERRNGLPLLQHAPASLLGERATQR